jgi:hypothetical protein
MKARHYALAAALLAGSIGAGTATMRLAHGQPAGAKGGADEGKRVFMRANCMGCHKWHGGGGGGYGGDALSLRNTQLDQEQIIETVSCGRPGTGMPHFTRDAYDQNERCFGLTKKDLGDNVPPEPQIFLRPNEIEAVANYVVTHLKGKGEPTLAECLDFFGEGSRVCNVLKMNEESGGGAQAPSPSGQGHGG